MMPQATVIEFLKTSGPCLRAILRSWKPKRCAWLLGGVVALGVASPPTVSVASHAPVSLYDSLVIRATILSATRAIVKYEWNCDTRTSGFWEGTALSRCVAADHGGLQTIMVRVTDDSGQSGTASQTVEVLTDNPTVTLATHVPVSLKDTIRLDATPADVFGRVVKVEWNCDTRTAGFLEGTAQSKCVAASSGGLQTIMVRVTDDDGQSGTTSRTVEVLTDNPTVTLSTHTPVSLNDTIRLEATPADVFGRVVKYEWNCDTRTTGFLEGTSQSKCVAASSGGLQTIVVRVTDDDGQSGTASRTVEVLTDNPTVTLSTHSLVSPNDTIRLDATPADVFGRVVKYEWNCDTRAASYLVGTAQSKCVAASFAGLQTIKVRVTDDDGQTGTATQTLEVITDNPKVTLSAHAPVSLCDTIRLNAIASDSFGKVVKYEWNCDTRTASYLAGTAQSKCLAASYGGLQTILVRVTDDDGQTGTASQTIEVITDNPTVTLSAHAPVSLYDTIRLIATASDSFGMVVKYEWNCDTRTLAFVEGTSISRCVAASYGGLQTIKVRVTDEDGQSSIATQTIEILTDNPKVMLSSHLAVSLNDTIRLNATASDSFGTVVKYEWNCDTRTLGFVEGTAVSKCAAASYSGLQTIMVRVTDEDGQMGTASQTVEVRNPTSVRDSELHKTWVWTILRATNGTILWSGYLEPGKLPPFLRGAYLVQQHGLFKPAVQVGR